MGYQFKSEDAYALAASIGTEYKTEGNELKFKYCPYCHGGDHKDKYTFAINLDKGVYGCLRGKCDEHGHFVEMCRDFNFKLEDDAPKIYHKFKQVEHIESTDSAIEYMQSRGISEEITRKYEISCRNRFQPWVISFPFREPDTNELVFVKSRNTRYVKGGQGSKEYTVKDTKPILFGMNHCQGFDSLIITEGQIDALSIAQAGYTNVVSVPMGCNNFAWTHAEICGDWVRKFKELIVFGDFENGAMTLIDKIRATFAPMKVKAVRKEDYLGEKDANDILRKYGEQAIVKAVTNAEVQKVSYVKELSTVRSVDLSKLDKIHTLFPTLDRALLGGMCVGQLVLLTGQRGDGKSTFMSQLIANALEQGESIFAYSGELADFHFKRWLDNQLAGMRNLEIEDDVFSGKVARMKDDIQQYINDWYKGRAYIYDNEFIPSSKEEKKTLVETVEKVIKNYNCRLICIDNLMTAMEDCNDQRNLYLMQSNFVGELKKIAMKYQVVIILVAHPRKSGMGQQSEFTNDDVSGSSDITNKVDIVINYSRDKNGDADSLLRVTKNRLGGYLLSTEKDAIRMRYNEFSKRITEQNDRNERAYGWELFNGAWQSEQIGIPWEIEND